MFQVVTEWNRLSSKPFWQVEGGTLSLNLQAQHLNAKHVFTTPGDDTKRVIAAVIQAYWWSSTTTIGSPPVGVRRRWTWLGSDFNCVVWLLLFDSQCVDTHLTNPASTKEGGGCILRIKLSLVDLSDCEPYVLTTAPMVRYNEEHILFWPVEVTRGWIDASCIHVCFESTKATVGW